MDFKRIKYLLIVFFLVFNSYLLFALNNRIVESTPVMSQDQETFEEELRAKDISFPPLDEAQVDLDYIKSEPTQSLRTSLGQLANQTVDIDDKLVLTSVLDQPLDLGIGLSSQTSSLSEEMVDQLRNNILSRSDLIIDGLDYTYIVYSPNERAIYLYMEPIEGYPITDGTAELRLILNENYQLSSYSQTHQTQFLALDNPAPLISQRDALMILNSRGDVYLSNQTEIQAIRLNYYRTQSYDDFNIYSPVWSVSYRTADGNRQRVLIDAIRGTIMNPIQL